MWISDWQMQCCGDPVVVGKTITLSTTSDFDREHLGVVLGESGAASLTDYEDHHNVASRPTSQLEGTVERIEAVSCRYETRGRVMYPVAGTARLDDRIEATGSEPEEEAVRFVGYIVTLRGTTSIPPHPGTTSPIR